jgi:hypothetical protein
MVWSVVGCSKAVNWAPKPLLYNVMIRFVSWLMSHHTSGCLISWLFVFPDPADVIYSTYSFKKVIILNPLKTNELKYAVSNSGAV